MTEQGDLGRLLRLGRVRISEEDMGEAIGEGIPSVVEEDLELNYLMQ